MDSKLIQEVKDKKIFSGLSDELVWRFLEKNGLRVKETRADLRKFFGVFLTNRVLKGGGVEILKSHISSKGRDYEKFYGEIFEGVGEVRSVVDLGCGVNGFSYDFLKGALGGVDYIGVEAVGQLVDKMNDYFNAERLKDARAVWVDLFNKEKVLEIVRGAKGPRVILMLQIIDALENLEKDYSKDLLLAIRGVLGSGDYIVISMPMRSISGKKKFEARRTWLLDFLTENFQVEKEKEIGNEKIIILKREVYLKTFTSA